MKKNKKMIFVAILSVITLLTFLITMPSQKVRGVFIRKNADNSFQGYGEIVNVKLSKLEKLGTYDIRVMNKESDLADYTTRLEKTTIYIDKTIIGKERYLIILDNSKTWSNTIITTLIIATLSTTLLLYIDEKYLNKNENPSTL